MKLWMKIVTAVTGLLVVVLIALSVLVNANTFHPMLETQLTTALGRQVKLGKLSFSVFSGSLVASDLSIADDPGYSTTAFLTAKELRIGVEMKPLIFSRQLRVRSFEVESPQIHLVRGANGSWNFSSIGHNAAAQQNAQKESAFPDLTVGLIAIKDGRAVVESLPPLGQPRVYQHVNLTVNDFAFTKQFPFALSASLPGDGTVAVTGKAGPINSQDAALTALDAQISMKHLDPVAAGFLDPEAGVSMLADIDAHATSDGQTLTSSGTVHAGQLQLRKGATPVPKPVDLTYNATYSLKDNSGQVQDLAMKIGNVTAHVSGTYQLVPPTPVVNLKLAGESLPIDELQALMSAAGVTLPNKSVLKGGTLTLNLTITGPANNLVIAGPLQVNNTQLVGFDIGKRVAGVAAMGGIKTGDMTSIQTLRTNVRLSNAGVKTDNIYALMPAVGEITGSGTVSPSGALAFQLIVKVTTARGIGKAGVKLMTALNRFAGRGATKVVQQGVPMTVSGTANNPVITADVRGALRRSAASIFQRK
ncbi:MAG TPA: AsmA family protein [Acidobacteriaceae bacterium]|jgi:AsmA protein|nr:AsmA family protein [Acidobacteriaceae bacterium]